MHFSVGAPYTPEAAAAGAVGLWGGIGRLSPVKAFERVASGECTEVVDVAPDDLCGHLGDAGTYNGACLVKPRL